MKLIEMRFRLAREGGTSCRSQLSHNRIVPGFGATSTKLLLCCADRARRGGEAIICNGEVVGFTTSANFGHSVGKPIAYGYVPSTFAARTEFLIEVYGEAIPAVRHDTALYDPAGARLRS